MCILLLQADSPELTKPPTTPEIEEPVKQPIKVKTSLKAEDLHDPVDNFVVEGRALHIISDSRRLFVMYCIRKVLVYNSLTII